MHQLASRVESSGETIFSKTLQGVITSWNCSAEQLFGYTADEIIGKSLYLLVPPERQKEVNEAKIANLGQEQHHHLERILTNGQHLLALVNDVLDLKKIETEHMGLNYSQVNVKELLTSMVEEMQPMAMAKHLVLRAEVAEGIDFLLRLR